MVVPNHDCSHYGKEGFARGSASEGLSASLNLRRMAASVCSNKRCCTKFSLHNI